MMDEPDTKRRQQPVEPSTPWTAATDGNLLLLQSALTELKLPPLSPDENGYTILHAASAYAQIHIIEWLMTQPGFDANIPDSDGDTPLHHAETADAARFLVEKAKADPSIKNNEDRTPLEAREEELKESMEEDDDEDEEDGEMLRKLIDYLKTVQTGRDG